MVEYDWMVKLAKSSDVAMPNNLKVLTRSKPSHGQVTWSSSWVTSNPSLLRPWYPGLWSNCRWCWSAKARPPTWQAPGRELMGMVICKWRIDWYGVNTSKHPSTTSCPLVLCRQSHTRQVRVGTWLWGRIATSLRESWLLHLFLSDVLVDFSLYCKSIYNIYIYYVSV